MTKKNNIAHSKSWNLKKILDLPDQAAIDTDLASTKKAVLVFVDKWKKDDEYLRDPAVLAKALSEYERLSADCGVSGAAGFYYSLAYAVDSLDENIKKGMNMASRQAKDLSNALQFFSLGLSKIDTKKQQEFLNDPQLAPYRHFLEMLFLEGKHTLSEGQERVLTLTSSASYGNWARLTGELLAKEQITLTGEDGKQKQRSFEEVMTLISSRKKPVRDKAASALNSTLDRYVDVATAELNSILEYHRVTDTLRGFDRPDASRHMGDDVDSEVVDALTEAVSADFGVAKDYYTLKARLMGQKKLAYHERNVEYGGIDKKFSYDEAVTLAGGVFADLDPEFEQAFKRLVSTQVDVLPARGKRGGAFCAWDSLAHPTFVFLNYTNELRDVTTLAHEMGHAIHAELMRKKCDGLSFGAPTSIAEVASTFMEDFVYRRLMNEASQEQKLSLHISRLNDDVSTIYRQIAAYRFEYELHEAYRASGYLSSSEIGSLFQKHMASYMGPAVEQSKGSENWWLYWSHIRYYFYNYSYAFGLLISKALQARVIDDPTAIAQVKQVFEAGSSASPREIFAGIGIDIASKEFWLQGLGQVKHTLEQAQKLVKNKK